MERFVHHGDRIVARYTVNDAQVTDCLRRQNAVVAADNFIERFKAVCDEILDRLKTRPRTVAQDNAIAELNRKNAEFWSRQ